MDYQWLGVGQLMGGGLMLRVCRGLGFHLWDNLSTLGDITLHYVRLYYVKLNE